MWTESAPSLRPLSEIPPELEADLPELPADGFELFVVTDGGTFGGQSYDRGEVLLCRGLARTGETTVLVAHGVGRPRLGTVEGLRFRGDGGEPCLPARWRSAGKLVARYRLAGAGWLVEVGARVSHGHIDAAGANPGGNAAADGAAGGGPRRQARAAAGGRGERSPAAQLSLFAA